MLGIVIALVLALSPLEAVKSTVDALKKAVGNKPLITELILEGMDLDDICKRSLGRNWKGLSEAQKKEYLEVCARYVEVFYRKRVFESIEFINSVGIKYKKERLDGEFAEVDVEVVPKSGDNAKLTFYLQFKDGVWKAYDVVVEGISQVSNLRSQFDRIIEKEKFEGLLRRLREKIKELDK